MNNYFETTVKYEKTSGDGKIVKATEKNLVDALSFTEAEARIIEEMKPFISGEFEVSHIKRARVNEIFFNEFGDKWFKSKVNFISLDEKKGIEKRTAVNMMIQADDIKDAEADIIEGMKGSLTDYEIASIVETKILNVYKCNS